MIARQLTLWDNEALETGNRYLTALKFEEAKLKFNDALAAGLGDADLVNQLIEACDYWQVRITYTPQPDDADSSIENIDSLLNDFDRYPFTPQMNSFKRALLTHIVSLLKKERTVEKELIEKTFDLLIGIEELENAEDLVSLFLNQEPENNLLRYLLAQVQWQNGSRGEANMNYVWLLLHDPVQVTFNRIENIKLQELIQTYGAAMAPAYGWLQNVVSLISLPGEKIKTCNDEHRKAIECYHLLLEANRALKNNEMKLSVSLRKQLKSLDSKLYAEYFLWLQQSSF